MHRSEAEGRFGEAEPAGRSSICARALLLGVKNLRLWRGTDWQKLKNGPVDAILRGETFFVTI